jgi:5-methylcytosine-specific restriction endonuclease McrA
MSNHNHTITCKYKTLLLNADCQPMGLVPVSTKPWKKSIEAMWDGSSTALHSYEDWIVRSPSMELQVPSVVMVNEFKRPRHTVAFTRENLFVRDGFVCQYCHEQFSYWELTFDHVHPGSMGGPTNFENIVAACKPCNHRRGCNTKIKPRRMPYKPSYWEMAEKYKQYPIRIPDESWSYYLDWAPELIQLAA